MDHLLVLLLLLWSSGLQAEENHNSTESVRLVGGDSRCAGTLEVKHQGDWRPVGDVIDYFDSGWTLKEAAAACKELDCGSAVSVEQRKESSERSVWRISSYCVQSGSALRECATSNFCPSILDLTCSDFVRLVDGTSLCSGRLEVKSIHSNQWWSSVCEADFDQQDAEVVCRELGCGAPSVLQGALYGDVEASMWTKEFQCGGTESALLDCRSSGSDRNTCSPGKAVGLTCSEPVRLVGGDSRCAGTLEVKQGDWRPAVNYIWTLKEAASACKDLDCGSAVSVEQRKESSERSVWRIRSGCVWSGSALRECVTSDISSSILDLTCSDFVRLVDGTSLCSGRLEVKSIHSNQWWSSVCEADFDQQDAEVVCRELGCGAPSVLQGALYGDVEASMWTKEFQCGGTESALKDCRSSGSDRNTCSPGKAVGLTCSEPVRLVGGDSHCAGTLEVKHQGDWRPVADHNWIPEKVHNACKSLDCGSAVSVEERKESSERSVWRISSGCVQSGSSLRECVTPDNSSSILDLTCSGLQAEENHNSTEYVRLVGGDSRCAGTLEVKHQGDWRPVGEDYFDSNWTLKDAADACKELDCGSAVSVEQRKESSYRSVWTIRFDCVLSGSALRECATSNFSPSILDLTCSDSVRLVNGTSLCSGRLEVKSNHSNQWWSSVCEADFDQEDAEVVCRELGCGAPSVLQGVTYGEVEDTMWTKEFQCGGTESALKDCRSSGSDRNTCSPGKAVGLTCSEPVRLVGGDSRCAGTLEVKHQGDWRPVFNYIWTLKEAAAACKDLDCGSAVSVEQRKESSVRSVWRMSSYCVRSGSALRECATSNFSPSILDLTCSGFWEYDCTAVKNVAI